MAYISRNDASQIREALKDAFPSMRFSVRIENNSSIHVTVLSGIIDFTFHRSDGKAYDTVNPYDIEEKYSGDEDVRNFLLRLVEIIKYSSDNQYYNKSDIMTDYFDVAFYYHINIGSYDKDYQYTYNNTDAKVNRSKLSDHYKKASMKEFTRILRDEVSTDGSYDKLFNRNEAETDEMGYAEEAFREAEGQIMSNTEIFQNDSSTKVDRKLAVNEVLVTVSTEDGTFDVLEALREASIWIDASIQVKIGENEYSI